MVTEAVGALLSTLELDERGEVDAAIARALAVRLDAAGGAESASGLARELRLTLDAIAGSAGDRSGFVAGLFGAEGVE
jgi:hypothetical protein